MKNKFIDFLRKLEKNRLVSALVKAFRETWKVISHNFGLKVLSLVIAILLWNFVISTNTSITRTKTVSGLTGYIGGQSILNGTYGLALLEAPSEELSDIQVVVEVSQSEFSKVSNDNVQVTLDLSSVRAVGTQEVPLKANTSYGKVVKIIPDSIPLTFESMDSRMVPVNVKMTGIPEKDRWYNVNRGNPSTLTVSGAASVVQSIASAYVYVDITDRREPFTVAEHYVLLDSEYNEIPQVMLDRSASSVSVNVSVYPTREIPISTELGNVIRDTPAEGYVVESVTIQPDVLTVAAEQELLDGISELLINPISVDGVTQSFAIRAHISKLSSFKWVSAEEVYVNVNIAEETKSAWVDNVTISYVNMGQNLNLDEADEHVRVYVTGPRSVVDSLSQAGFAVTVDLTDLEAGTYAQGMQFPSETYPDIVFTPEKSEIHFTLVEEEHPTASKAAGTPSAEIDHTGGTR